KDELHICHNVSAITKIGHKDKGICQSQREKSGSEVDYKLGIPIHKRTKRRLRMSSCSNGGIKDTITRTSIGDERMSDWEDLPWLFRSVEYLVNLIEKYSVLPGLESIKNQESKKSPKEIIKIKREQGEKKQESKYTMRSTDKVALEERLITLLLLWLLLNPKFLQLLISI
ncbi:hypothetical protein Tco_0800111, partial [Tanacetum coccineum]